jgi:hypothetical protein
MYKHSKLEGMSEKEETDHATSPPRWIWIAVESETEEASTSLLNDQAPQSKGKVQQQDTDSEGEAEDASWIPEEGKMDVSSYSETSYDSDVSRAIDYPWVRKATHKQQRPQHPCPLPDCNRATQSVTRHLRVKHLMTADEASRSWNEEAELHRVQRRYEDSAPYVYYTCPFCPSRCLRLDKHLRESCPKKASLPDLPGVIAKQVRNGTYVKNAVIPRDTYVENAVVPVRLVPNVGADDSIDEDDRQSDYYLNDTDDSDFSSDRGGDLQAEHGTEMGTKEPIIDDQIRAYLEEFWSWLGAISGGLHSPATARDYSLYVTRMLGSQGPTTDSILRVRQLAVPGGYLDQQLQLRAPTTVRAYVAALRSFFEFLREEHSDKFSTEFCMNAESLFGRWSSGLQRKIAKRRHERQELDALLMPQVAKIMSLYPDMNHRREAITALEAMQSSQCAPSRDDYFLVQNYLVISLLIANACRSGSIVHAKITEWKPKPASGGQHTGYTIRVGSISVFHGCAGVHMLA